ncbi:MAG: M23 family metallopeptidase [Pseudomonadota bacterium]
MRDLLIALFWMMSGEAGLPDQADSTVTCGGALSQGGLIVCTGPIGSQVRYDGAAERIEDGAPAIFGITRDAELSATLTFETPAASRPKQIELTLAERIDDYRVLEGLDCDKVDARTPQQIEHAGESWVKKQAAFSTFDPAGARLGEGFILPSVGRPSSPFGPTRKYIGVSAETGESCDKTSVHRGYDIAAPVGTDIIAPAAGTIILADLDLYYEGGTIFLDHGGGLVSVFMHMSALDVAEGDVVDQGELLGKVGNTGRTTGPHLHWAVKWRDTSRNDRGGDFYIDPALLLDADLLP